MGVGHLKIQKYICHFCQNTFITLNPKPPPPKKKWPKLKDVHVTLNPKINLVKFVVDVEATNNVEPEEISHVWQMEFFLGFYTDFVPKVFFKILMLTYVANDSLSNCFVMNYSRTVSKIGRCHLKMSWLWPCLPLSWARLQHFTQGAFIHIRRSILICIIFVLNCTL